MTPSFLSPPGKYNFLVSGEAESQVSHFLEEEHSLQEYQAEIERFRGVAREISSQDDVVHFDMFQLECHDIKHGLWSLAEELATRLVTHLAQRHIAENQR